MATFATLKKTTGDLDRLAKAIEKINAPAGKKDEEKAGDLRFWQPEVDKSGNGMAVIRFLPAPAVDGDDSYPWVRVFSHYFKGPTGKAYWENSLTTLGQKDPVADFNSALWNSTDNDNSKERKQVRDQKRKLTYISNILVISDPKHPENEGKVFLYKYGKKIFDKITQSMNPEFEGDAAVNPFDMWKGANFKLRIRTVDRTESNPNGYRNYDMSVFDAPSAIPMTDEELEKLWKSEYSLKEFIAPDQFKPYDVLKARLDEVLGIAGAAPAAPAATTRAASAPVVDSPSFDGDEDDEELNAFKKLAL